MSNFNQHTFDGVVWRVFPDTRHRLLLVEVRHTGRRVSFAAWDLTGKQIRWDGVALPETWWSSGIGVYDGMFFLQTFPDGQNPDPRGITAVDAATGRICWQRTDVRFVGWQPDGRVVARPLDNAETQSCLLDTDTGAVLGNSPELTATVSSPPASNRLVFPVHYPSSSPYFPVIAAFLKQRFNISPEIAFDYAEFTHVFAVSYYIYVEKQLENHLLVFDTHSQVPLLHEKLATQRTGIGIDTFFLFDSFLVCVQEQTILSVYEI
ncbi:MAG: DUF4905 domain-containing protein [Cytophagales bacterium]|nr:DUF4905 domain-containing protein [Cytophagales bacterium]